jgi:c-di-GMP-binding flagellar brake protein YcgR
MACEIATLRVDSPQTSGRADRRQSIRHHLDTRLVARPTNKRSRTIHGRIIDLSQGGISAVIAADLQLGEVMELRFGLPYAATGVLLEAVIRRRESYQYSLEFTHVTAADRAKIDRTCAALLLLQ